MKLKSSINQEYLLLYCPWILISLISLALFSYSTWCGLGLTYDSLDYLYAAKTWSANFTLQNANQTVFQERTPLFPIIISCLSLSSSALHVLFGISLLIILNGTLFIYTKAVKSYKQQLFFSILLAFAPPLYLITNYVWSEVFFTVMLLISLYCVVEYSTNNKNYKALIIATVFAFLYCLQRNTGIFFVMASTLFLLLYSTKKTNLLYPVFFALIALSGWAAWTAYHYSQRGLDFQPTLYEIGENIIVNLSTYLDRISLWLLPNTINSFARSVVCAVFIITSLTYTVKFIHKNGTKYSGKIVVFILLIIINYIAGMSLLEKANEWEVDRFIAILYPLCMLFLGILMNDFLSNTVGYKKKTVQILLCCAIAYPCIRSFKNCYFWHKSHCNSNLKHSQ